MAARVKISMSRNLKVYIDENISLPDVTILLSYKFNAVSGIDTRTKNMNTIIVMVPQKNEIKIVSFLATS